MNISMETAQPSVVHDEPGILAALLANAVLGPCHPDALESLARNALAREGRRGTRIAQAGVSFPYLGIVLNGVVGVTACAGEQVRGGVRNLRLYESYAGETFCDISFLDGYEALGEITIVSKRGAYALLPSNFVMQMGEQDPALLLRLAVHTATRCRLFKRRLVNQAARTVTERVAEVLVNFAGEGPGMQPVDPQLLEFAQRDIAAVAGCVKEAAARAIAELENVGALRRERGRIRYIDRAKLIQYTEI
ncbi:MAG TPA: Crp/Fnr family transcriptional regulator [Candidatus Baltobacteraceae bacterium]|nr:Crp/Fnr family transcriptional regulator [Candidatus Baltobacteraceae bacterium]